MAWVPTEIRHPTFKSVTTMALVYLTANKNLARA